MAVATATVEGIVKRQNDNLVALWSIRHKKAGFVNYFIDKYKKIYILGGARPTRISCVCTRTQLYGVFARTTPAQKPAACNLFATRIFAFLANFRGNSKPPPN